jgi:hypothetical protein
LKVFCDYSAEHQLAETVLGSPLVRKNSRLQFRDFAVPIGITNGDGIIEFYIGASNGLLLILKNDGDANRRRALGVLSGPGVPAQGFVEEPRRGITFEFHRHPLHVLIDDGFVRDAAGEEQAQCGQGEAVFKGSFHGILWLILVAL